MVIEMEEQHTKRRLPEMIAEVCAYGYRCLVLRDEVLTDFADLDLAVSHDPSRRADYVFNFIFLPVPG